MMTFKKEHSHFANMKQEPSETITVTTSSEGLMEVISAFERFLHGCGYVLDGHIDFVYDDEVAPVKDDGAGNDMSDEQWEINRVTAEGEVIGTIEPFKWTKGSELSWKHDPRVPSIYEDGYESPSNGATETDPNWPFPSGKTP